MQQDKYLKSNKGITLLTLTVTIVVMLILSFTISINVDTYVERRKKTDLETDIAKLKEEISHYYNENKALPIINKYTNINMLEKDVNDNDKYYVIDVSKFSNLELNYGKDYEKITDYAIEISDLLDIYIINEQSHVIYYPKGIKYDGKIYYTINSSSTKIEDIGLQGIAIEGSSAGKVNETIQLKAKSVPEFVENSGVTWSSSDENIATIDETGKVTLKSIGKATITATLKDDATIKSNYEIECYLQVSDLTAGEYIKYDTG